MKRMSSLQKIPKKFIQTIVKSKDKKEEKQSKTKEFTSGKFFSEIQALSKTDNEKRTKSKPKSNNQLSSRKLKL